MQNKQSIIKPGTAVADVFKDKYVLLGTLAVIASAVCAGISHSSAAFGFMWELITAWAFLTGSVLAVNMVLAKRDMSRSVFASNMRSLDPKITGYVTDISGIGSLLAALAAVSYALSQLYISNDGQDRFYVTAVSIVCGALMIGCSLGMITSRDTLFRMVFVTVSDITDTKGEELIKCVGRTSLSHELTGAVRRISLIALSVQIGMSLLFIVSSLTSVGLPFPLSGIAVIYAAIMLISMGNTKGDTVYGEEKLRLFAKGRSFGVLNTVMYVLIAIAVMYTFPFRSVYTSYTVRYEYYYTDAAPEGINVFSIPEHRLENEPLFMAMFILSAFTVIVMAFTAIAYDSKTFSQKGSAKSLVMIMSAIGLIIVYSAVYSLINSVFRMNAVMWLVSVSLACLMLGVNLIRILVVSRRSDSDTNKE